MSQGHLPSCMEKADVTDRQEQRPKKVPKVVIRRDQIKDIYSVSQDNTSLMIKITFSTCPRTGKESCKFFGSPTEFTDLMEHALKLEGNWTQTKDPENHKIFKTDNAAISWWNSTKILSISGKRENDIHKHLKAMVKDIYSVSQDNTSLMIKITFNTCPRTGKESCKFFGSPTEFTDLMEHALKLEGNWTQTKDPENHKIFKTDNAAISWWNSTKTLSISGKRENDICKYLKAMVQKGKSAIDHTYNISQVDISSDHPPLNQSTTADTHTTAMDTIIPP